MTDPICEVAGCGGSASGKKGDPGHHPAPAGTSRPALFGFKAFGFATVRTAGDGQDAAG